MAISKRTKNSKFFDSINVDSSDIEFQLVYRHYLMSYIVVRKINTFSSGTSSREIQLKSILPQFCYRASIYVRAVLGVVILSVCPSVRPPVCHTLGLLLALCTLSALPNDVMSKIQCRQLHNKFFGHIYSTVQLHSLFALSKLLLLLKFD